MNDFKQLIRKSTVMSLRPGQVVLHEHGLKHTVKQPHKYVVYEKMDKPIYKSGYSKYSELQRWKELFGNENQIPKVQTAFESAELPLKPLEEMSDAEWKQWIDYAKSKSPEYLQLLDEKKENEMHWKKYLGLDKLPSYPVPQTPVMYSNQKPLKVKGRILRAVDESTLLVGVQGFVCSLDQHDIPSGYPELLKSLRFGSRIVDREKEYNFFVLSAQHNR
jgi:hypothetical protein